MKKIKIIQILNGKIVGRYNSACEAAEAVNGQESHISECIRNIPHRHTHKGYKWRSSDGISNAMGKAKD